MKLRWSIGVGFAALVLLVAFCSLRASPRLMEITWLPRSITQWADAHGVVRNVVAFGALALATFLVTGVRFSIAAGLVLFAVALELAQLWLPHRFCDWRDVVASAAGVAIAWPAVHAVRYGWTAIGKIFGVCSVICVKRLKLSFLTPK